MPLASFATTAVRKSEVAASMLTLIHIEGAGWLPLSKNHNWELVFSQLPSTWYRRIGFGGLD